MWWNSDSFSQDARVGGLDLLATSSLCPDLVLLFGLVVKVWILWLTVFVWLFLNEVELDSLVTAEPLAVHLVGHLLHLLKKHLLVE